MAEPGGGGGGFGSPGGGVGPGAKKAAEELAAVMGRVQSSAAGVTAAFEAQLRIVQDLKNAMSEVAGSAENLGRISPNALPTNEWQKAVDQLKNAHSQGKKSEQVFSSIGEMLKSKFTRSAMVAGAALSGLKSGFSGLVADVTSITGVFTSIIGSLFELSAAILAVPFHILNGLTGMAQGGGGGGGGGLAEAIEEVRAKFGDMNGEMSKTIMNTAKMTDHFKMAGLTALRAFGPLPERLKKVNATISAMGNAAITLLGDIQNLGDGILAFNSGLGITEEMMPGVATWVTKTGQSMSDLYIDITKQSKKMAAAMGINAKVMSSDMAKAMQDAAHFGHMSTTALAGVTAYTQKLGISIEKLTGMMDKFDTFEGAADSASTLNSALGTNIDAMELMNRAQDGSQLDYLRQQFSAAGKDISKMDYHTRKLLASATNMDQATLDQALGQKNASVTMDKFKETAEATAKETWSMDKAIKSLTNDIQRFVGGGGGGDKPKTFLEALQKGFVKGFQSIKPFQDLMRNIRKDMIITEKLGIDLGKMFANNFPGIKQMIEALADMFDPAKFQKLANQMKKIFGDFFDPQSGAFGDVDKLFKNIQDGFMDFFNSEGDAGSKFLDGFEKFSEMFVKIFAKVAKIAVEGLSWMIESLVEWMRNPGLPDLGGAGSKWAKILSPLMEVLKIAGERLWPAIKDLGSEIMSMIGKALFESPVGKYLLIYSLTRMFAPAIMAALLNLAGQGILAAAGALFGKLMGDSVEKEAAKTLADSILKSMKKASSQAGNAGNAMAQALPNKESMEKMDAASRSNIAWDKLSRFLIGLAGVVAIGLIAFWAAAQIAKKFDTGTLIAAGLMLLALVPIMGGMALVVKAIDNMGEINGASLTKSLLAMGAILVVGIGAFWLGAKVVAGMDAGAIGNVGLMFAVIAAAMLGTVGLLAAAVLVARLADQYKKEITTGMIAMGGSLIAIAAVAAIVVALTGGISSGEISNSVSAMRATALMMLASLPLMAIAGVAGQLAQGAVSFIVTGMAAMALAVLAVAAVAWTVISMLGDMSAGQLSNTVNAMTATALMMLASIPLMAIAAAVGVLALASAPLIAAGMVAMGLSVIAVAAVAWLTLTMLGGFSSDSISATVDAMNSFMELFTASQGLITESASIGALAMASWHIISVGMLAMAAVLTIVGLVAWAAVSLMDQFPTDLANEVAEMMTGYIDLFHASAGLITTAAKIGALALVAYSVIGVGLLAMAGVLAAIGVFAYAAISLSKYIDISKAMTLADLFVTYIDLFQAVGEFVKYTAKLGADVLTNLVSVIAGMSALAGAFVIIGSAAIAMAKFGKDAPVQDVLTAVDAMSAANIAFVVSADLVKVASEAGENVGFSTVLGIGAMAAALWAISSYAKSIVKAFEGISADAMTSVAKAVTAMITMFEALPGFLAAAAKTGAMAMFLIGPTLIGVAAIGKAFDVIIELSKKIVTGLGGVDTTTFSGSVKSFETLISSLSTMGPAIEGIAKISETVDDYSDEIENLGNASDALIKMVEFVNDINQKVNTGDLNISSIKEKIGGLGDVMKVVTDALQPITKLTETFDLEDVSSYELGQILGKIQTILDQMVGSTGSNTGMLGIVSSLKTLTDNLSTGQIESFKAIGPIFGGMGQMMQSMTEPLQKMSEGSGMWDSITGGPGIEKVAEKMTPFIQAATGGLGDIVSRISEAADKFRGVDKERMKAGADAITAILGGLVSLSSSLKPADIKLDNLDKLPPNTSVVINNSAPSIKEMLSAIETHMPVIIQKLVAATSGIDASKAMTDKIKVLSDIFGFIKTLGDTLKTLKDAVPEIPGAGFTNSFVTRMKDVTGMLNALAGDNAGGYGNAVAIKEIAKKLNKMGGDVDKASAGNAKKAADFMKDLGSVITTIKEIITAFPEGDMDMAAQWVKIATPIGKTLEQMGGSGDDSLQSIANKSKGIGAVKFGNVTANFNGLKTFLTDLKTAAASLSTASEAASGLSSAATGLESLKTQLSLGAGGFADRLNEITASFTSGKIDVGPMTSQMKTLESSFKMLPGQLKSFGASISQLKTIGLPSLAGAADVAAQLAGKLNEVSQALGGVDTVDVRAKLSGLAGKMGVGGVAKYSLQASKDVTINLTLTVHMDAGATGNAIARSESVLKTTINSIIEKGASTEGDGQGGSRSLRDSGVNRLS